VKASPKVTRMPYSTGLSTLPSYIGVRNIRSKAAPRMKAAIQASEMAMTGLRPGNQTAVRK